jgi:dTDP-L-rhamnose 4-epimerase
VKGKHTVRNLVVASSMSVYGEGKYYCLECGVIRPRTRSLEQLKERQWEVFCPTHQVPLKPIPIDEDASLHPASIYAVSKRDQEEACLVIGRAYAIPTIVFRYFGVYGQRQSLSNPYAGLMAMFASRLINGKPPLVFEDGEQIRDFIHVLDVVRANLLAIRRIGPEYEVYNLGTGKPTSVVEIAKILARYINPSIQPELAGQARKGDIRHCYADMSKIRDRWDFVPKVALEEGLAEVAEWASKNVAIDKMDYMRSELKARQIFV